MSKTPKKKAKTPQERAADAIAFIESEHLSFRKACAKADIDKGDAWRIVNADTVEGGLAQRYARAREARGHAQGEAVAELGEAVLAGVYAPDVARVALDAMKWSAARMAPKTYGDRTVNEHSGPDGAAIPVSIRVIFGKD